MTSVLRIRESREPTSLSRIWAVSKYELLWDLRKKRTYVISSLLFVAAIAVGYAVPVLFGKNAIVSGSSFPTGDSWIEVTPLLFNGFISGIFPLLIGGFSATDSIATEFDKGTIIPLLSQPVKRKEVFMGKFLEKFLLLLIVSFALIALDIFTTEISIGAQQNLLLAPVIVAAALLTFLEYTVLAFFFGSFSRSGSLVLFALLGLLFAMGIGVMLLALKIGIKEWMDLLPIVNSVSLISSIIQYVLSPASSITVTYKLGIAQTQATFTALSQLEYTVAGCVINLIIPLLAGYAFFKRSEVRG